MDPFPLAGEDIWHKTRLLKYNHSEFRHERRKTPASRTNTLINFKKDRIETIKGKTNPVIITPFNPINANLKMALLMASFVSLALHFTIINFMLLILAIA